MTWWAWLLTLWPPASILTAYAWHHAVRWQKGTR